MTPKVEELVARLQARLENVYDGASQDHHWMPDELCHEAADSLTILSARAMELEAALRRLLSHYDSVARDLGMDPDLQDVAVQAKAVLQPNPINEAAT